MKTHLLCLVYGGSGVTQAKWARILDDEPAVLDWRSDMVGCFYLVSTQSADEAGRSLSERVKAVAEIRLLVFAVTSDRQGWLPKRTWDFIGQAGPYAEYVEQRKREGSSDGVTATERSDPKDSVGVIAKASPRSVEPMTPEALRAAYEKVMEDLLYWGDTKGSARKWWQAFLTENERRPALILRLCEELAARRATITEFFLAYVYSNVDNIQANLHYLDYSRLKKAEADKKLSLSEEKSGVATRKEVEHVSDGAREHG